MIGACENQIDVWWPKPVENQINVWWQAPVADGPPKSKLVCNDYRFQKMQTHALAVQPTSWVDWQSYIIYLTKSTVA